MNTLNISESASFCLGCMSVYFYSILVYLLPICVVNQSKTTMNVILVHIPSRKKLKYTFYSFDARFIFMIDTFHDTRSG